MAPRHPTSTVSQSSWVVVGMLAGTVLLVISTYCGGGERLGTMVVGGRLVVVLETKMHIHDLQSLKTLMVVQTEPNPRGGQPSACRHSPVCRFHLSDIYLSTDSPRCAFYSGGCFSGSAVSLNDLPRCTCCCCAVLAGM